jgi:hypothetical protein
MKERGAPGTPKADDLTAKDPAKRPATAAPVMIALDGNIVGFGFGWKWLGKRSLL